MFLNMTVFMVIFRRRESTDVEDLFIAHISGMDTLARGLRNVAKLIEVIYSSFLGSNTILSKVVLQFLLIVVLSSFFDVTKGWFFG